MCLAFKFLNIYRLPLYRKEREFEWAHKSKTRLAYSYNILNYRRTKGTIYFVIHKCQTSSVREMIDFLHWVIHLTVRIRSSYSARKYRHTTGIDNGIFFLQMVIIGYFDTSSIGMLGQVSDVSAAPSIKAGILRAIASQ